MFRDVPAMAAHLNIDYYPSGDTLMNFYCRYNEKIREFGAAEKSSFFTYLKRSKDVAAKTKDPTFKRKNVKKPAGPSQNSTGSHTQPGHEDQGPNEAQNERKGSRASIAQNNAFTSLIAKYTKRSGRLMTFS